MRRKLALVLIPLLIPLLAACGASTAQPVRRASAAPPPTPVVRSQTPPPQAPSPRQPVVSQPGFLAPKVMDMPGLEGVIGADAARLEALFGPPRLDVREGDARKLQFTGEPCVLDIYLYPLRPGTAPSATYVDARRASDGLDVDRAACVAALKR